MIIFLKKLTRVPTQKKLELSSLGPGKYLNGGRLQNSKVLLAAVRLWMLHLA